MEGDTIESICEHYGCSVHSLVQCNGGGATLLPPLPAHLRIPVKIGFPVSKIQSDEKNVIVQRFLSETNSSQEEADEFLAVQSYDFIKAMNLWDQSHSWEQRYLDSLKQVAPIYITSYSPLPSSDVAENSVGSALPPPPLGYDWKALPNGEWELVLVSGSDSLSESVEAEEGASSPNTSSYFHHRIKPSDTLEGLCLRYHVTQRAVMKLNHLSTKKIQFLKELRIPLRSGQASPVMEEEEEAEGNAERDLIQNFAQEASVSLREAKYYLQLSRYDFQEALREWRADEEWCQKNELGNEMRRAGTQPAQQTALEISY
jgi:LysM repeat protein